MMDGSVDQAILSTLTAPPTCIYEAAIRQQVPIEALLGLLRKENGKVGTVAKNTDKSLDFGPAQINSVHLATLSKTLGRKEAEVKSLLIHDACFNIHTSAWRLRAEIDRVNGDFWRGVGNYHSRTPSKSNPYALAVHQYANSVWAKNATLAILRLMNGDMRLASN